MNLMEFRWDPNTILDGMACRATTQAPNYISRWIDEGACCVDFLETPLAQVMREKQLLLYVFPPWEMIQQVMNKVLAEAVRAVILVPLTLSDMTILHMLLDYAVAVTPVPALQQDFTPPGA